MFSIEQVVGLFFRHLMHGSIMYLVIQKNQQISFRAVQREGEYS